MKNQLRFQEHILIFNSLGQNRRSVSKSQLEEQNYELFIESKGIHFVKIQGLNNNQRVIRVILL